MWRLFRQGKLRRGKFTLANPKAHTASRTHCTTAPKFRQGKVSPPSFKTQFSRDIIAVRNNATPLYERCSAQHPTCPSELTQRGQCEPHPEGGVAAPRAQNRPWKTSDTQLQPRQSLCTHRLVTNGSNKRCSLLSLVQSLDCGRNLRISRCASIHSFCFFVSSRPSLFIFTLKGVKSA